MSKEFIRKLARNEGKCEHLKLETVDVLGRKYAQVLSRCTFYGAHPRSCDESSCPLLMQGHSECTCAQASGSC